MNPFYLLSSRSLPKLIVGLFLSFALHSGSQAQDCVCTNCPQFMPDNFVGNFLITVMGASNNMLGQNGQGVCGVNVHFDHEYLGDLSIVLTSPAGQSVTLIGPIGLFGGTDFSEWNVSFVPCGDVANPDPGFNSQWNNNQGWGTFGNYTGSYYPFNGCLENFNTGPVNGTWTLTVTDGQGDDVGNFLNYEIIFCDPSGIMCFSCAAQAGDLPQADINACQGSPNLMPDLPPSYTLPQVEPPMAEYSYTYVISGAGGVILAYEDAPDLSSYDPGVYTICGLSYFTTQSNDIPAPDGSLTIAQLNTQLGSNQPPFCGDLTGNCVNVTINASPDNEEETVTICAPECYEFFNQNYCQSGTYVRNLTSPQGCPYTATLYLTVNQPSVRNFLETVCDGDCATTPGFEAYCSPGMYQEVFTNYLGCDSIVNLNLQVLGVVANISPPGTLSCATPSILLQGIGSTIGSGTTYLWTASNGGHISGSTNTINTTVDQPGDYQLLVCRTAAGVTCCDSTSVTVFSSQMPPAPPASIAGLTAICQGQSTSYTATTVPDATSYIWTVPAGVTINSGQNTQTINITWNSSSSGNICVSSSNNCGTSTPTCLAVTVTPAVMPGQPNGNTAVCAGATENYSIPPIPNATAYAWTVTGGNIASGQGTPNISVVWGSSSGTVCVNATGPCGASNDVCVPVNVTNIPNSPIITSDSISCPGSTELYTAANVAGATTYNWLITNGVINMGQGNDSIQVLWNSGALDGIVCVNAGNQCGNSADYCLNIGLSIPLAGQIMPDCDPTNQFYTIAFPISGGTPPYSVSGGTVTGNQFLSAPIPSGQPYNFTIVDANLCNSAVISGSFNCNCATDAGTMALTLLEACSDQTVTAQLLGGQNLDGNDTTAYVLHSNPGTTLGTIFGQNNSGTFGIAPGMSTETTYYISFVVGNNIGGTVDLNDPCLSVSQGQPVVFYQYPVANAGVDMDTCGLTIQLAGNTGTGTGHWNVESTPAGASLTISGPQNPNSSATASDYGVYTLSWTLDNNGCIHSDTVSIDFNNDPVGSNTMHTCDASNDNYTVSFDIVGGNPNYQVTPSGNVTGNVFTSNPIPNTTPYSFVIVDATGCESAPVSGIFSCNCATNAGTMDVSVVSACEGGSVTATHLGGETLDGNDIWAYYLHTGSSNTLGTVLASNNTGTFSFQSGMNYGTTYYVSYVVGDSLNGAPDLSDFCLSVAVGQPVVFYLNPVANAGIDLDTCGTTLLLNGNNLPNSTAIWTVSSGNAADLSIGNPGAFNSTVIADQPGTYQLSWTITQNGCIGSDQVNLQFNNAPVLADITRVCDSINENFSVTLTLTNGVTPYSVNGTVIPGNVFVSNLIPSAQNYSFNVTDANGCTMPSITGAFSCNCLTSAGTMSTQSISVCEGLDITIVANSDQVLDGNDVISYVLHSGAGPALGQVFAQNNTGVFSFQNGMNYGDTYYVSLVAGNPSGNFPNPMDPCFSVAVGQPVIWLKNPVPNAGADDEICGEMFGLVAVSSGFPGIWTQVSGPGTASFSNNTDSHSAITVDINGSYTLQWTETNGTCVGSDLVTMAFHENPVISVITETCNGTNTAYSVGFSVSGGTAPYTVLGLTGAFNGNQYTSNPIQSGSSFSFGLVDANDCPSASASGTFICNCTTNAGSMQISPAVFCADTPATGIWNNDGTTDANDLIQFVLHSDPGSAAGTIFARNTQPTFNFAPPLQTGVVYYISAIAGNNVAGNVSLIDPCLSIAPGVPVQWKPMPTAVLSGDASICAGSSTVLSFSGTGTYPLTVTYTDGNNPGTLNLASAQMVTQSISPTSTQTFTLLSVVDGTMPVCSTTLNSTVTITVNQPVNAGLANDPVEFCAGTSLNIVLSNLITGADFGGIWTETSANPSTPGAFNANTGSFQIGTQPAGAYTFKYSLNALAPCVSDEETVTVLIHPIPVADAGENKTINCDQPTVTLGGAGTSPGTYEWTSAAGTVGSTAQIIVADGGTYTLNVTNQAGCTDSDETNVSLDNEEPVIDSFTLTHVRCYGEGNGVITINAVTSAHPPVQYSINGGAFQGNPVFSNLPPNDYTITVQDANGCETSTGVLTVSEPALLVVDMGPNLALELGDSVHLVLETNLQPNEISSILWSPLLDTSATRPINEQHFLPLVSSNVSVEVTDINGCKEDQKITIKIDKPRNIFIPNVFDPVNGKDGKFYIYGGRDVAEIESFRLFDRWGTQIFEFKNFQPNDPAYGWDGSFRGNLLNPSVFIYQAVVRFIDGEKILYKGDVTLIR